MSKADDLRAAARDKAHALLDRSKARDAERIELRDKERRAQDAKITRLRELRLAKEAADKAAKQVPSAKPRSARRKTEG
jgi:hypothetical protein